MSLHDELVRSVVRPVQCHMCLFLNGLSPEDRAEWEAELRLPNSVVSHASVQKVIASRNAKVGLDSISAHRKNHQ